MKCLVWLDKKYNLKKQDCELESEGTALSSARNTVLTKT